MSLRQKLLTAIATDPKNAGEIAKELDLDRKVVQDNISAAIKEQLAYRKIEDGKPIYGITAKGLERLGNPHSKIKAERPASGAQAQPEVANNTGSAGSATSSEIPTEARALIYTAETAELAGELAIALDRIKELNARINEQAATIDNLRIECSNLEFASGKRDILTPEQLIRQIRTILGNDFGLAINSDTLTLHVIGTSADYYQVDSEDLFSLIEALRFINDRKVA